LRTSMPRVHFVKKARKNYRAAGIKRGDSYWWYETKRNGRFTGKVRCRTKPRRSQLTGSEYLSEVYGAQEALEDAAEAYRNACFGSTSEVEETEDGEDVEERAEEAARDELADAIEQAAEHVRQAGEACTERHDNMPESLKDSETGRLLERRAEACETLASALDDLAYDVRGTDASDLTAGFADEKLSEIDWSEAEE
jgi:hypothetical protein